jgi:catechol 2,3-dioxygenase-like lactoylglutathione lyase family enzyme
VWSEATENMIERIDHLVLTVKDVEATLDFYQRVLDMKPERFNGGRRALSFGSNKINLHQQGKEFEPKARQALPGTGDLCLITQSPINEVVARLAQNQVAIEHGPVRKIGALGPMLSVYFRDLDGNLIEVSNYSEAPTE